MSSYPVPFHRRNHAQSQVKNAVGFMSDGTGLNPSDPNSMIDQGHTRNSVYNIPVKGVPDVTYYKQSKSIGKHDPGIMNNTFYSFGA